MRHPTSARPLRRLAATGQLLITVPQARPSAGKILADLVTTGWTDLVGAAALSVRRFAEGRQIHESAVL